MRKKQLIETHPNYYHGQLLREDDLSAEQNYHVRARLRHNVNLHGWGVVRGLEVSLSTEYSVLVSPGYAIDRSGRDILVNQSESLEFSGFGPNELIRVGLAYEEEPAGQGPSDHNHNEKKCYAVLMLSRTEEETSGLILATLRLDGAGKISRDSIDYSATKYATMLTSGSVTARALDAELRTGWLRMPLRPAPLVDPPQGEDKIPPAFRVGQTEARTPHLEPGEKDMGAAGTMAIPIPPSVKNILRFRIAGSINEGEIKINLSLGGWDPKEKKHNKIVLVQDAITNKAPFLEEYPIADSTIRDPEYRTLSLWLWATRRTSISLIAVEFGY